MSRQSHLPPRGPYQKKPVAHHFQEKLPQHHRYPSLGSIAEDQPSWLDDLLSDQDSGHSLRRTASDPAALLCGTDDSCSGLYAHSDEGSSTGNEVSGQLELASVYGPNSPRQRSNVTFSGNAIASALSDYVLQTPIWCVDGNLSSSGNSHSDLMDSCGSVGEAHTDTANLKRHSGQRSRVRKLQYIAELERTVDAFQTIESELAVKVASLLQKRVSLSLENSKLKQQFARLKQEKLIMEGQYRSMKKEVERLRNGLQNSPASTARTHFPSDSAAEKHRLNLTWQMLDMAKLNLN